jgi:hypothetical protein
MSIQGLKQALLVAEIAVKIDFREKQGEILEILPGNSRLPSATHLQAMADNVLVILQQNILVQLLPVKEPAGKEMVKTGDIVLVRPSRRVSFIPSASSSRLFTSKRERSHWLSTSRLSNFRSCFVLDCFPRGGI